MAAATEAGMVVHDRLEEGRAAFNRGDYFEAHEIWEEGWHQAEGAQRVLVQGLIQIAAGLHHLQQGRPRPAAALLRKGLEKVGSGTSAVNPASRAEPDAKLPSLASPLLVDDLMRDVAGLLVELEGPGPTAAPLLRV